MINEELQKEWNDLISDWRIALGMPKLLDITSYLLLELSSTISGYGIGIALEEKPPVALPHLYSNFIKAHMFSKYVMNSYLGSNDGRKKLFQEFLESVLNESKEHLKNVIDNYTISYKDR